MPQYCYVPSTLVAQPEQLAEQLAAAQLTILEECPAVAAHPCTCTVTPRQEYTKAKEGEGEGDEDGARKDDQDKEDKEDKEEEAGVVVAYLGRYYVALDLISGMPVTAAIQNRHRLVAAITEHIRRTSLELRAQHRNHHQLQDEGAEAEGSPPSGGGNGNGNGNGSEPIVVYAIPVCPRMKPHPSLLLAAGRGEADGTPAAATTTATTATRTEEVARWEASRREQKVRQERRTRQQQGSESVAIVLDDRQRHRVWFTPTGTGTGTGTGGIKVEELPPLETVEVYEVKAKAGTDEARQVGEYDGEQWQRSVVVRDGNDCDRTVPVDSNRYLAVTRFVASGPQTTGTGGPRGDNDNVLCVWRGILRCRLPQVRDLDCRSRVRQQVQLGAPCIGVDDENAQQTLAGRYNGHWVRAERALCRKHPALWYATSHNPGAYVALVEHHRNKREPLRKPLSGETGLWLWYGLTPWPGKVGTGTTVQHDTTVQMAHETDCFSHIPRGGLGFSLKAETEPGAPPSLRLLCTVLLYEIYAATGWDHPAAPPKVLTTVLQQALLVRRSSDRRRTHLTAGAPVGAGLWVEGTRAVGLVPVHRQLRTAFVLVYPLEAEGGYRLVIPSAVCHLVGCSDRLESIVLISRRGVATLVNPRDVIATTDHTDHHTDPDGSPKAPAPASHYYSVVLREVPLAILVDGPDNEAVRAGGLPIEFTLAGRWGDASRCVGLFADTLGEQLCRKLCTLTGLTTTGLVVAKTPGDSQRVGGALGLIPSGTEITLVAAFRSLEDIHPSLEEALLCFFQEHHYHGTLVVAAPDGALPLLQRGWAGKQRALPFHEAHNLLSDAAELLRPQVQVQGQGRPVPACSNDFEILSVAPSDPLPSEKDSEGGLPEGPTTGVVPQQPSTPASFGTEPEKTPQLVNEQAEDEEPSVSGVVW